jgi:hypothetical protein
MTIHRISFQNDDLIITSCGQEFIGSRNEIAHDGRFTLFGRLADCPECDDRKEGWRYPLDAVRPYLRVVRSPLMADNPPDIQDVAETVARLFHEHYERLAPEYGYTTREASAVPWAEVPEANRDLMAATVMSVLTDNRAPLAIIGPVRLSG